MEQIYSNMINVLAVASGYSGNLYHIADVDTTLLIEAGIYFRVICEAFLKLSAGPEMTLHLRLIR